MYRYEIEQQLTEVTQARRAWAKAQAKFQSDADAVMSRLLHEALARRMSIEQIARYADVPTKRVRRWMREAGLNPDHNRSVVTKQAAENLANNAALLGVEPTEIDLMSPLAYLPAGQELRQAITDTTTHSVHDIDGLDDEQISEINEGGE